MSEKSDQLVEKDASSSSYPEPVVVFEMDLANASAEVERLTTQHSVNKDLLDGVHTDLASHKIASQPRVAADTKDCDKLSADTAAVDTEFRNLREDLQAMGDSNQASLNDELKRAKAFFSEPVKLLVSEKSLQRQL